MKIMGLMLVRNESWILNVSLRSAMQWCDEMVVVDHCSTDGSYEIIGEVQGEYPYKIHYSRWSDEEKWDEMDMRQHSLLLARDRSATHLAIVDADEIMTANIVTRVRQDVSRLKPGEVIDYPMIPMRSLEDYQDDRSVWSQARLSTVFMDAPNLSWRPGIAGYQHHNRCPYGSSHRHIEPINNPRDGGVMHLQFANERRLLAKHVLYRMVDHLRWPGRDSVHALNTKYDEALKAPARVTKAPEYWWYGYDRYRINMNHIPWQEGEIRRLLDTHGRDAFKGLDLKGF